MTGRGIAVIGGGISGLTAGYILSSPGGRRAAGRSAAPRPSQLARFKADPAHQGLIMDRGLWRYTRHPNYFGDFCILTRGTGQRLTDQRMAATRPQYADYAARTSGFIPLPPRRGGG